VLDWVRERATGVAFADALADLWRTLGCTEDAMVAVDGDGVALAGGGVAAAAGDWARVGLLQIDGTVPGGGAPLLDRAWVDTASHPSLPFLRPGRLPPPLSAHVGFGYHWWPLDDDGSRVAADGSRGQFVYVDRPRRTVVVKTSAWAYADPLSDAHCRDLTYRTLPVIAATTAAAATQGEVVQR
jgi:CubicO group peptidase (beta-lactamase class C family)